MQVDLRKTRTLPGCMRCSGPGGTGRQTEAGEISQEEYDRWRYHYPEYDSSQIRAKVPPEGLI